MHNRNQIIVEYDIGNAELEKIEREADQFASNILISSNKWSSFIARESFHTKDIRMFSRDVGVDAGIVVSRLQHEGFFWNHLGETIREPGTTGRWTNTRKFFFFFQISWINTSI